jgi:hypothetical protein
MSFTRGLIILGKSSRKKNMPAEGTVVEGGATSSHRPDDSGLPQNISAQRSRNAAYGVAVAVSVLTFLVYLKSLQNEFVNWDDDLYVYENPSITSFNLRFFRWAFFDFHAGNWHPLTWISHALDYTLWGLNPLGHHLTSNILHATNTFLAVVLVARLLEAGSHPSPALKMKSTSSPLHLIIEGWFLETWVNLIRQSKISLLRFL